MTRALDGCDNRCGLVAAQGKLEAHGHQHAAAVVQEAAAVFSLRRSSWLCSLRTGRLPHGCNGRTVEDMALRSLRLLRAVDFLRCEPVEEVLIKGLASLVVDAHCSGLVVHLSGRPVGGGGGSGDRGGAVEDTSDAHSTRCAKPGDRCEWTSGVVRPEWRSGAEAGERSDVCNADCMGCSAAVGPMFPHGPGQDGCTALAKCVGDSAAGCKQASQDILPHAGQASEDIVAPGHLGSPADGAGGHGGSAGAVVCQVAPLVRGCPPRFPACHSCSASGLLVSRPVGVGQEGSGGLAVDNGLPVSCERGLSGRCDSDPKDMLSASGSALPTPPTLHLSIRPSMQTPRFPFSVHLFHHSIHLPLNPHLSPSPAGPLCHPSHPATCNLAPWVDG